MKLLNHKYLTSILFVSILFILPVFAGNVFALECTTDQENAIRECVNKNIDLFGNSVISDPYGKCCVGKNNQNKVEDIFCGSLDQSMCKIDRRSKTDLIYTFTDNFDFVTFCPINKNLDTTEIKKDKVYQACWGMIENKYKKNIQEICVSTNSLIQNKCEISKRINDELGQNAFWKFIGNTIVPSVVLTVTIIPTPTPIPTKPFPIPTLNNVGSYSSKKGTKGYECWIKPFTMPEIALPDVVPNVLNLRNAINDFISSSLESLSQSINTVVVPLHGSSLCNGENVQAAFYKNGTLIENRETAIPILKSISKGWKMGKWDDYDKFSKEGVSCECVGEFNIISKQKVNIIPSDAPNQALGISTVKADAVDKIFLISDLCTSIPFEDKSACISKSCDQINYIDALSDDVDKEKKHCNDCLTDGKSYYTGMIKGDIDGCVNKSAADYCKPLMRSEESSKEIPICSVCVAQNGIWTAIGCIYTDIQKTINEILFPLFIGTAGIAAIFCIIISAINMQVSSGNPEAVSKAQQMITSCITGLILIIFSVLILKIIGVDILRIPSLSK